MTLAANKSITQLKSLWISLILIVLLSGGCAIWIVKHSNLIYNPSYEGVNNLLVVYKVPLSLLALIIPTVAIIASNHRSVQAAKQIELSNTQNIFTNYFKHKEEFESYLKRFDTNNDKLFEDADYLHRLIFPNAIKGDLSVCKEEINSLKEDISDFKELCRQLETVDNLFGANLGEINQLVKLTCSYFCINSSKLHFYLPGSSNRFEYVDITGKEQSIFIHGNPINLPYKYLQTVRMISYAMSFCSTSDNEFQFLREFWKTKFESDCTVETFKPIYSTFYDA